MSWSTCKYCREKIVWAQMPHGQWLPVDPDSGQIHKCVGQHRANSSGTGGHGTSSAGSYSRRAWPSMRDLAEEVGHSLVFPATCKFCGQRVYLFAAANRGFAVFDDLGHPWPKHNCGGYESGGDSLYQPPELTLDDFPVPVGHDTEFAPYRECKIIAGMVVANDSGWNGMILYNGHALFKVKGVRRYPIGAFIRGMAMFRPEIGTVLEDIKEYLPPAAEQGYVEQTAMGSVKQWK